MTYQDDFTLPTEFLEQIASEGFDILVELIRQGIAAERDGMAEVVACGAVEGEQLLELAPVIGNKRDRICWIVVASEEVDRVGAMTAEPDWFIPHDKDLFLKTVQVPA